jgi:hypothetical protein
MNDLQLQHIKAGPSEPGSARILRFPFDSGFVRRMAFTWKFPKLLSSLIWYAVTAAREVLAKGVR